LKKIPHQSFIASGCGKTTLLNIISGLDKDFDGSVQTYNDATNSNISYMFQAPRLFPWLTAIENIKYPIKKRKNCEKIAFELIKKIGLEKYKNQYPNKLSGGMQRRIALARAFASNPDILLLDEPFISIDKKVSNFFLKKKFKIIKLDKKLGHNLNSESEVEKIFKNNNVPTRVEVMEQMIPYIKEQTKKGTGLNQIMRHTIGLFHGQRGSSYWKRYLSENMCIREADLQKVNHIMDHIKNNNIVTPLGR